MSINATLEPTVQTATPGWLRTRESGLLAVVIVVAALGGLFVSGFARPANFEQILLSVSILLVVAVAELLVMLTGNIDISVGSMVGICAFVAASFASDHPGAPVVLALLLGAGLGLALGAVNGLLVVVAGVPSIMATLGTLYVFRGVDSLIAGSKQITASTVPDSYLQLASARIFGVNVMVWLALAITLAAGLWLKNTKSGRHLYAVGNNGPAARAAGIHSRRLVFGAFAACGLLCGIAGTLWGARFGTVTGDAATGFELQVLAAVVVGGVSVRGGVGTVTGVFLGAFLLGAISNALSLLRVSQFWLMAIAGAALLVAVTADHILTSSTRRRS